MRKIQLDGKKIKELRDGRDRAATQKEFAHEIGVSERQMRAIENANAPVTNDVANRIARALNRPLQGLLMQDHDSPPASPAIPSPRTAQLLPRFDQMSISAVFDEVALFDLAKGSRVLVSHIRTPLTSETSAYTEELISILRSLTWEVRTTIDIDALEEIGLRRRIRELLVLMKGNDVLVYADSHLKLPEKSFDVQSPSDDRGWEYESQMLLAFGPPSEFGETSINVPIDRGRPSVLTWGGGAPPELQPIDPELKIP